MDLDEDVFATGDSTQRIAAERLARLRAKQEAAEPTTGERVGGALQGGMSGAATGAGIGAALGGVGAVPGAVVGGLLGAAGGALGVAPNTIQSVGSNASKVQDALKTPQDLSSPAPKKTVALGSGQWDFDDDEMAA